MSAKAPSENAVYDALALKVNSADLGTDVATALAVNVGTDGAFVVKGGALGTPSSGDLSAASATPTNEAHRIQSLT